MINASKMARYMLMRNGSGNRENGDMRRDYRPNARMGYGDEYERENEVRNGYGAYGNEGGQYVRDNYGVDNRFRDRRGREHYDNGRFAPLRNALGGNYDRPDSRGERYGENISPESRWDRETEIMPRNNWDEEDRGRMNMIGFERPQEVRTHYPTRIDYHGGDEMEHRSGQRMTGGAMGAEMDMREMDRETAEKWVECLPNEEGGYGGKWKLDQVKALMSQKAMDRNPYEIYAVMNALYSDYGKILRKRGITAPDVFLDMAIAFIDDKDAVRNKPMAYYERVVKHE